jgi:nitrite reductase/ring-hydroxylating ferredoxin subunit
MHMTSLLRHRLILPPRFTVPLKQTRTIMTRYTLTVDQAAIDKPGSKVEATVDGLQDTKVLLVNVQGKVNALSPRCTHYGAPLVRGVLTSDGRITCPCA